MTLPETRWHRVGDAAQEDEAAALEAIRELLPDDPRVHAWTNIRIPDARDNPTEIDLLLVHPAGIFVLELKGWAGRVVGRGYSWTHYRKGRSPERGRHPIQTTDSKAKRLKSVLQQAKEENGLSIRLPYVQGVVVMHGRGSAMELNPASAAHVYGLDGFSVKGVPALSRLLKTESGGLAWATKQDVDTVVRLLRSLGMEPVAHELSDDVSPTDEVARSSADQDEEVVMGKLVPPAAVVEPLLESLTDDDLEALGVPAAAIASVRSVMSEPELIGVVPDEVVDFIGLVLAGDDVPTVVARRQSALSRLAEVDEQEIQEAEPEQGDGSAVSTLAEADHVARPVSSNGSAHLDVHRNDVDTRGIPHQRDEVAGLADRPASEVEGEGQATAESGAAPERLLDLATQEVLAGRYAPARALLERVERWVDVAGPRPLSSADIDDIAAALAAHPVVSQRVTALADTVRGAIAAAPSLPVVSDGAEQSRTGQLWHGGEEVGRAYSLLLRVPDVLDRVNGRYLSQVIGPYEAAAVHTRLLQGRPDGGRVRITSSGTVVSRRDAASSWFVVGVVTAGEWFPPDVEEQAA